jgi:hypothetical protein
MNRLKLLYASIKHSGLIGPLLCVTVAIASVFFLPITLLAKLYVLFGWGMFVFFASGVAYTVAVMDLLSGGEEPNTETLGFAALSWLALGSQLLGLFQASTTTHADVIPITIWSVISITIVQYYAWIYLLVATVAGQDVMSVSSKMLTRGIMVALTALYVIFAIVAIVLT